jgi:hypothetical protein
MPLRAFLLHLFDELFGRVTEQENASWQLGGFIRDLEQSGGGTSWTLPVM